MLRSLPRALVFLPVLAACAAAAPSPRSGVPAPRFAVSGLEPPDDARAVPVVLFHGACDGPCPADRPYDVPRAELEATLDAIAHEGYRTLSIDEYVAWFRGERPRLGPQRPVLLTFDDGKVDGWLAADAKLREHGQRATMYVITQHAEQGTAGYMTWPEVESAAASGRWDVQLHAHGGHVRIAAGPGPEGTTLRGGYYARRWYTAGELEAREDWWTRVKADLDRGDALLAQHVPGYRSSTFAVPFEDWGQMETNDPVIPSLLAHHFDARFEVWFTQPDPDPADTAVDRLGKLRRASRYLVTPTTRSWDVLSWLSRRAR